MKSKRPFIYLGLVILIGIIVFFLERPDLPKRGDVSDRPMFPHYNANNITKIEISQLLSGVILKKDGDNWFVSDLLTPMRKDLLEKEGKQLPQDERWYPADPSVVSSALGVFGDFPHTIIVSKNSDEQNVYQVQGPLSLNVKLFEGDNKTVDVSIGKRSTDFAGNYIMIAGTNEVRLFDRIIDSLFETAIPRWRDHTIWRINPAFVKKVGFSSEKSSYELARTEGGEWELVKPAKKSLDQDKVSRMVERLSNVRARAFASNNDPISAFEKPESEIKVELKDGTTRSLDIGGKNNLGQFYAKSEGDSQIYLIANPNMLVPSSWKELMVSSN